MAIAMGMTDYHSIVGTPYTRLCAGVRANASGTLTEVKTQFQPAGDATGFKVATFYVTSGTTHAGRDVEAIGNVTGGSVQTFSDLNISVATDDRIGCYYATGTLGLNNPGCLGIYDPATKGDYTESTVEHKFYPGYGFYLYATGTETAVGGQPLKNVFGRPFRGCFR